MRTPSELYFLWVQEQPCILCNRPISNQRYHADPERDGFVHSMCLAVEVEPQRSLQFAA